MPTFRLRTLADGGGTMPSPIYLALHQMVLFGSSTLRPAPPARNRSQNSRHATALEADELFPCLWATAQSGPNAVWCAAFEAKYTPAEPAAARPIWWIPDG